MKGKTYTRRWLFPLSSATICLGLYLLTMAPGLTWSHNSADGGDLIAAASTLGIPHPPGYPLYTLLAQPFLVIPLNDPAWRMNLYSAIVSAITIFFLCDLIRICLPQQEKPLAKAISAIVAIAAGTAALWWSQAIITEVYALANLFAVLTIRQALLTEHHNDSGWFKLGLWQVLALLSHPTMLLLVPAVLIIIWPHCSRARCRNAILGVLIGLVPLAYLPIAAANHPSTNWGNASTLQGFGWLVSGAAYQDLAFALPAVNLLDRLRAFTSVQLEQYGIGGTALAILGFQHLAHTKPRLLIATGTSLLALSIFAIGYNTSDSFVYLLPAFILESIWIAWGLRQIIAWLLENSRAIAVICLLTLPILNIARNYQQVDVSKDTEAIEWYTSVLETTPTDAILITCDDRHTFAIAYAQQSLQLRQDVLLIDVDLWNQDWYARQIVERESLDSSVTELPLEIALQIIRPDAPYIALCDRSELSSARSE